jgi:hypothetical protein
MHHLPYIILISGFPVVFWTSPSTSAQGRARRLWSALGERESSSDLIQISYPTAALKYYPENFSRIILRPRVWKFNIELNISFREMKLDRRLCFTFVIRAADIS